MSEQRPRRYDQQFPYPIDFERNAYELVRQFTVEPEPVHMDWAKAMPLVHGCSARAAAQILEQGAICAPVMQKPESTPTAFMTGELDIELGQDQYVFFNLGKTFPLEPFEVYFVAAPERARQSDAFVAMRDIATRGGLVSIEMQNLARRQDPTADIAAINRHAAAEFFASLVRGRDFAYPFARFLATHYPEIDNHRTNQGVQYWRDTRYPGDPPLLEKLGHVRIPNVWEGPQVQIANSVLLEDVQAIIVGDPSAKTLLSNRRGAATIPIIHAEELAEVMEYSAGKYTSSSEIEQRYNRSFYVNLAVHDVARHNVLSERS